MAKYTDLRAAFTINESSATSHFITTGSKEGRSFDSRGNDTLIGSNFAESLKGGNGDDIIRAQSGNDILNGGIGNNTLDGGTGSDAFVFDTAMGTYLTTILDFNTVDDQIYLDDAIFTGLALGNLSAHAFTLGISASNADSQIIFNSANGDFLYDADGIGSIDAVHFATLVGIDGSLTSSDFVVV